MAPALEVLGAVVELELQEHLFGGASIDMHGTALTDEVLAACRASDAVLLGAVGGPKWDTTDPRRPRPEQGLLGLRKGLGLYANLRPVRPLATLYDASPLRRERIDGTDLLATREEAVPWLRVAGLLPEDAIISGSEHAAPDCLERSEAEAGFVQVEDCPRN